MSKLKLSKLYTSIITTIILFMTVLSGSVFAEEMKPKYVYDSQYII